MKAQWNKDHKIYRVEMDKKWCGIEGKVRYMSKCELINYLLEIEGMNLDIALNIGLLPMDAMELSAIQSKKRNDSIDSIISKCV